MTKKKIVVKIPDTKNEPALETEFVEKPDKDLDYFKSIYPEADENLVCRLYKSERNEFNKEKRTFLDEFNYVPNEKDIAEKFGGGDFELYLMTREGVKGGLILKAKAKFSINKVWTRQETDKKQDFGSVIQSSNPGLKDKLEELKMMKDVMFDNKNGNDSLVQMMLSMQTALMSVIVDLIKNVGKSDNKMFETILPTLLNKSLEKQNVISDIETIAKLKEIFPAGEGGTDWGSVISSTLPLLLPLLAQNGNQKPVQIPQHNYKPVIIDKKLLKESVKEAIEEINTDYDSENETNSINNNDENENIKSNISELKIDNQNNNEMNIESQIKLIKNAPMDAQDQVLKMWCNIKPVTEVMEFCINTDLVKDKDEFIIRAKKVGIDTTTIE